jgi:hypothetical protein
MQRHIAVAISASGVASADAVPEPLAHRLEEPVEEFLRLEHA